MADMNTSPMPQPEIDPVNERYWTELKDGRLFYQQCSCSHRWLPARALCPRCLGTQWEWKEAAGRGEIYSWVVYHVAYHPAFKDRLPYNVAIVQLEEGPRLITNILAPNQQLSLGARVRLASNTGKEIPLAQFQLA
ncbi:hypothetical protein D3C87_1199160 [compost metagenome]